MSWRKARTEADATTAPADSEEKDVKIPVEAADETVDPAKNEHEAAGQAAGAQAVNEDAAAGVAPSDKGAASDDQAGDQPEMTEDEMVEAAIRAGEEAAENDFKMKYEQAQTELVEVRQQLAEANEVRESADAKVREAQDRVQRLQADWENFRRRTAQERLAERDRATEKLVCALLPVIDDIERALDHARTQELSDDFKQFVDGVDAVHTKMLDVLGHEGVETIDPKGEPFNPLEHQAVGRVEDASQYEETVNDVYQKGYRMADRILRSAMVTVTYGGEKRPAPEPDAAPGGEGEAPEAAPAEQGAAAEE